MFMSFEIHDYSALGQIRRTRGTQYANINRAHGHAQNNCWRMGSSSKGGGSAIPR